MGTVHIDKVEIVVSSNASPERVAQLVYDQIDRITRVRVPRRPWYVRAWRWLRIAFASAADRRAHVER